MNTNTHIDITITTEEKSNTHLQLALIFRDSKGKVKNEGVLGTKTKMVDINNEPLYVGDMIIATAIGSPTVRLPVCKNHIPWMSRLAFTEANAYDNVVIKKVKSYSERTRCAQLFERRRWRDGCKLIETLAIELV